MNQCIIFLGVKMKKKKLIYEPPDTEPNVSPKIDI
jgi:hypothetical protein